MELLTVDQFVVLNLKKMGKIKTQKIIFITGAHGFIGRNSAKHFNDAGWYVIGIGLGDWNGKKFQDCGIHEWHHGIITEELLLSINKKPDVILHCAGGSSVGFSVEHSREDYEMTVGSTKNVLEFIRLNCPETRLIYPSSAGVYGQKEDILIKESDILNPISPYGQHKKIVEELCREYSDKYSINISIVRLFSVYGPGLQKQLFWDACNKILSDGNEMKFFGTGLEKRDWIYITDVVELFLILAKSKNKFEVLNGGSGIGISVQDILIRLLKLFGVNKEIIFNNIIKKGDPRFLIADTSSVKNIGWQTKISLDDGIKKYVIYFKKYEKN